MKVWIDSVIIANNWFNFYINQQKDEYTTWFMIQIDPETHWNFVLPLPCWKFYNHNKMNEWMEWIEWMEWMEWINGTKGCVVELACFGREIFGHLENEQLVMQQICHLVAEKGMKWCFRWLLPSFGFLSFVENVCMLMVTYNYFSSLGQVEVVNSLLKGTSLLLVCLGVVW